MTSASAASVPPPESVKLQPDFHFLGFASAAGTQGEGAPAFGAPHSLAGADPPKGRILVVEPQAIIALDLQRILQKAGYRVVGPATSVADVRALLGRGRIDCAVVDLEFDVEGLSTLVDLLVQAGVPFVVLGSERDLPTQLANRPFVEKPYAPGGVLTAIQDALAVEGHRMDSQMSSRVPWPRVLPEL